MKTDRHYDMRMALQLIVLFTYILFLFPSLFVFNLCSLRRHQPVWHRASNAFGYRIHRKPIWRSRYGCIVAGMECAFGYQFFRVMPIVVTEVGIHLCQNGSCCRLAWKFIRWPFYSKMQSYWAWRMTPLSIPAMPARIFRCRFVF